MERNKVTMEVVRRSVRGLVGQMGEEWEDGVVYVGATNIFRYCSYSGETTDAHKAHEVLHVL